MPEPERYAAFVSYAHRHQAWVEVLHRNLEACLRSANASPSAVFLDKVDLGSGRSWVGQLQAGLDKADHLILVVTPEALASPRVGDEWEGFVASRPDWLQGHFHLVRLVDTPLPPFLAQAQWVDFAEHDEAKYRDSLRELAGALVGRRTKRDLPELPPGIDVPDRPSPVLRSDLRSRLVGWLEPRLRRPVSRRAIGSQLGVEPAFLEGHPSWACAASALLVRATGADAPVTAALRVVDGLLELFAEEPTEDPGELTSLRDELLRLCPAGEGSGLLASYLAQVESDHDRLVPYFQQRAELGLLDRVYVKLELRPEVHQAMALRESKKAEGRTLDRPLGIREVLGLDAGEHPWVTGRWVIVGDPGSGKTTLVRHLAAALARDADRPWVPVLESLPRMLREREWLLDRIARRMKRAGQEADALPSVLDREGREGRLLLLLDGLDEVPKDDRPDAEALLRDLSTRWPKTPVVVTSRPIGYRRPGSEYRELELLPLDEERRREFLARWFGRMNDTVDEARAGEALDRLREEPGLWELAGNPLYLTLMALLLEQGNPLQRHRARLYDQVFELLLEGKHRPDGQPMDAPKAVRRILDHLGYELTEANHDSEPYSALEARLYKPEADPLREQLERVPRWRQSLRPFLDDLAERTGILGPHDGPDADWRFWHRTFREALAAEELAERWRTGGEAAILACAREIGESEDESRWAEPYALLAGRVADPDALVKALVAENRALGYRALATVQGLREETLFEVLELSGEWKERAKVYPRVPELVRDAERSLLLLDRLRRRTRNGNDLYFLDLAVRDVGRRWPDHARSAEALRGRLYDHVPRPPAKLFEWIDTPLDGRVSLWREIPAGEFWLGSPDGEGDDDEHPRRRVTVASGFRIASVPVTGAQFTAFDPEHRARGGEGVSESELPTHPVVGVTWFEAVSFCRWLASLGGRFERARLPSDEEWEYACRAATETRYWSGDNESDLARVGWYGKNSGGHTHQVGEKPASPWGLYDVHGNVFEWTLMRWDPEALKRRPTTFKIDPGTLDWEADVPTEPSGGVRVLRGGSFGDDADWARAACRGVWGPGVVVGGLGFRVVLPFAPEP